MPLDPQVEAILAAAPPFTGFKGVPLDVLRQSVRETGRSIPMPPELKAVDSRDLTIEGPGGALPLRLYLPQATGSFPVTQFMHGGGFVVGDLDLEDKVARALALWGETLVVSVAYRLAPEHPFPAANDDCWAALQWIAGHIREHGGDPARIAVAGGSAGANLAAALALRARDAGGPELRAQALIYGSCNYPTVETASAREYAAGPIMTAEDVDWFWEQYLTSPEKEQDDPQVSPMRAESLAGLPPAFIVTAECDPSRDDCEAYAARLLTEGVETRSRRFPGMVHGFTSWVGVLPAATEALHDVARFLRHHLGEKV